jgi:hypothetical protein
VRAYTSGSDAFAAKLDSSGNLTWNTFLGGSGDETGRGVAVDGSGNVYVTGTSFGPTWGSPVRAYTKHSDAYAAKLNSSGTLLWNTFLGGSADDFGNGVAVDGSGNVYVAGFSDATWGSPVRAYTSGSGAFAAKLDSSGNLTWNTFLGGFGAHVSGQGVAVDGSGNVYVAGRSDATWGSPVRAYSSGNDAFAAKLNSSGTLLWNTFLGGSGEDFGQGVAVDGNGNVYIAGRSDATWGSPVRAYTNGNDAFAAKLNSSGALVWNTFIGGSGDDDEGLGVAVDGSGNVYVAGYSNATWGSPDRAYTSSLDAFAAKLDSSGSLSWNTFLGGSGDDDQGQGVAVDGSGNVYVSGYSNATWGSPVRAFTSGDYDAFVAKISGNASPTITAAAPLTRQRGTSANSQIATVNDADQPANTLTVSATPLTGSGVTINNISVDASGNVTANVAASCTATNSTFKLTVTDNQNATATDTLTVKVTPSTPPTITCPGSIIRFADSGQLGATINPGAPLTNGGCSPVTISGVRSDGKPLNALYPIGVTMITWTAKDASNNTATCMQPIVVMAPSGGRRRP